MLSFTTKGILDVHFDTKDSEMLTVGKSTGVSLDTKKSYLHTKFHVECENITIICHFLHKLLSEKSRSVVESWVKAYT